MIVRAQRNTNFTIISNVGLRDERLSYKARGLLAYLLSMPDHWRTNERHLAAHAPDGRHAVRSGLKELEQAGYLIRQRLRLEDGTFDWHSVIYDEPQPDANNIMVQKPNHGTMARKSDHRLPDRGKTDRGKARQIVKTNQSTPKQVNTNHNRDDDDDDLRTRLREIGVPTTDATLRHYRQQAERHGLAAVLDGLDRAAAHGTQTVRLYVDKCIASAAAGEDGPDSDEERRRAYVPDEYADIIIH